MGTTETVISLAESDLAPSGSLGRGVVLLVKGQEAERILEEEIERREKQLLTSVNNPDTYEEKVAEFVKFLCQIPHENLEPWVNKRLTQFTSEQDILKAGLTVDQDQTERLNEQINTINSMNFIRRALNRRRLRDATNSLPHSSRVTIPQERIKELTTLIDFYKELPQLLQAKQ